MKIYPEEEYGNWQYIPFSTRNMLFILQTFCTLDRIDYYYYSKHVFVFIFACLRTSYNSDNVPLYTLCNNKGGCYGFDKQVERAE